MDIKKKTLIIVSIIIVIIIGVIVFFLFNVKKENASLIDQNKQLKETNDLLVQRYKQDSMTNKLTEYSNEKQTIIKYIEKRIINDSLIFMRSDVTTKERLFAESTDNY